MGWVHGVGVEMKNDLSWARGRILFSILFLINGYLADLRIQILLKRHSRATNTFLRCKKNIIITFNMEAEKI